MYTSPLMTIVYTKSNCMQCNMTKRYLDKKGIEYDIINIEENDSERERLMGLGFSSAPVVSSGDMMFAGFQPDRLAQI